MESQNKLKEAQLAYEKSFTALIQIKNQMTDLMHKYLEECRNFADKKASYHILLKEQTNERPDVP